jgi:hypothetical protein
MECWDLDCHESEIKWQKNSTVYIYRRLPTYLLLLFTIRDLVHCHGSPSVAD